MKKERASRKRAEYLATLPKQPIKRFFYRLHPKRVAGFIFSRKGMIFGLKSAGIGALIVVVALGGIIIYFRKDLDAIKPGDLNQRVQTTVTKYYDRNDNLLWEDKGDGDYTLTVSSDNINDYMREATIAIEDKDFYKHGGVSISGVIRSIKNNLTGGSTQGGSTLTQQLVKQAFFDREETQKRGLNGIPRKIKEAILAVEVERMYDKEQILTLYLNESSYGGRRNGVESGARTYFGKSAKELTLAEAALLAAIPNQPGLYDPYNKAGNEALIARQHLVLDRMSELGYVNASETDQAKKVDVLSEIKPVADQFKDIKAPHFVQMVRSQLEKELGSTTVGRGGLTVKTTLDIRIQDRLEGSMNELFSSNIPTNAGFTNGAATVEDTQTGQIVALMGSRDFNYAGFGQDNAATAFIQPGSTIKPFVYSQLLSKQPSGINFGSGSILADDNSMNAIYGAPLHNADGSYKGNITIRKALGVSRNIPAVKAMYIAGVQPTLDTIRAEGNLYYCTQGEEVHAGLAAAIGGCGTRQIDLVNAYATFGREGVYKPTSSILEVKNNQGQTIKQYKDEAGKRVIDPQVSYIISDILSDDNARLNLYGSHFYGLYIPGVKTAAKTGTSDKGGQAKDIWTASYSPALSMAVWLGNSDNTTLKNGNSSLPAKIIGQVMEYAHKDIYGPEGKWKASDWFNKPSEIKTIKGELYPSWYDQKQIESNTKLTFDKISKFKATDCTPEGAKQEIDVIQMKDPITKKDIYIAPDGYDATKDDNTHLCSDTKPGISGINVSELGGNKIKIKSTIIKGSHDIQSIEVLVNGQSIISFTPNLTSTYTVNYTLTDNLPKKITINVIDQVYYSASDSINYTPPPSP